MFFFACLTYLFSQKNIAIIIGINPGSLITDYAVVQQQSRQLIYLGNRCICTQVDDLPTLLQQY